MLLGSSWQSTYISHESACWPWPSLVSAALFPTFSKHRNGGCSKFEALNHSPNDEHEPERDIKKASNLEQSPPGTVNTLVACFFSLGLEATGCGEERGMSGPAPAHKTLGYEGLYAGLILLDFVLKISVGCRKEF